MPLSKPHLTLKEVINRPVVGDGNSDQGIWDDLWIIALDLARPIKERADAIRHMDKLTGEPESEGMDDIALVKEAENQAFDVGAPLVDRFPNDAVCPLSEEEPHVEPDSHPENHLEWMEGENSDFELHITAGDLINPYDLSNPTNETQSHRVVRLYSM